MARRVLVTRPEPAATETAAQLTALGFEPVVLPLSEIMQVPLRATPGGDFDFVAITSANAVRHAAEPLLALVRGLPCFTVGGHTAAVATAAGFGRVITADGDVEALTALIARQAGPGSRIAYLCGQVRRPDFEAAAARNGWQVTPIETYGTRDIQPSASEIDRAFAGRAVDFVLVYSVNAAAALNRLLADDPAARWFGQVTFCCLSSRIGVALNVDKSRIRLAERPEQDALLDVLGASG